MSNDPVAAYQAAIRERDAAAAKADSSARVIADAGRKLANWRRVVVSNIGGGGYPPELTLIPGRSESINAHEWPSIESVHRAISEWHEANFKVRSAWNSIPQDRRTGLVPPT